MARIERDQRYRIRDRLQKRNRRRHIRSIRSVLVERLEERCLLVSGPVVPGITVNGVDTLKSTSVLNEAPQELLFRFDENQEIDVSTLDAIKVLRSVDGDFESASDPTNDDQRIVPGYINLGNQPNEVVLRFAETLPDDIYRIEIDGSSSGALQNTNGDAFNEGIDYALQFELDLGAQILAVVPQPVSRVNQQLIQARDQIVVYFNNDDLNPADAANPEFYQLIFSGHSNEFEWAFETDKSLSPAPITPQSVTYDFALDRATLTFAQDLAEFGEGTYRLRIGTQEVRPSPPLVTFAANDPSSSFADACYLGSLAPGSSLECEPIGQASQHTDIAEQGWIIAGNIGRQEFPLTLPGSNQDPGHRQVSTATDKHILGDAVDSLDGVSTVYYNFKAEYAEGFSNAITETQKQRAREIFELYSHYLGVQFIETPTPLDVPELTEFTVVTGDVRAIRSDATADPDLLLGLAGDIPGFGLTAVVNGRATWDDGFGESWFQEAMRQIGSLLGLGSALDLPPGTIMGGDPRLTFGLEPEPVFPGDHDIVHGQHLHRPDSVDIDLYSFTLDQPGELTAEIFAQRLDPPFVGDQPDTLGDQLDSVLRLYRQTDNGEELISQNDDYFGADSYLELELEAGTYFIGVSSKGNDQYDPSIENTGFGGTSQGPYELRLHHRPVVRGIQDSTGTDLDGDADGLPGGVYNFWFRVQSEADTIFVDKTAAPNGTGSRLAPFDAVQTAMNAAQPGSIVRVVGNSLHDDDLENDLAYEIGIDPFGRALPDGGVDGILRIKRGVTLMIDAGAVFKLRRGSILVGSSSPTVDRSGAALQVLGIPETSVYFTSFNDDEIGVDRSSSPPSSGDWGGILFRGDSDRVNERFEYESQGIFLNHVNGADIRYGGGIVLIDSVPQVVNPISMIDVRPTVTQNSIQHSADAAMSASPNAFEETNFHDPEFQSTRFTSDYVRIGPEIHGNHIIDNTINGLAVVRQSAQSGDFQIQSVSARWNDREVVHVVTQSLLVDGQPGGQIVTGINDASGLPDAFDSRINARLMVDPGVVVKLEGARIEIDMGATFLAEGTNTQRAVFTSLLDDRFGFGGTFDTNGDALDSNVSPPQPGDWQGIYIGHTAIGSIDHAIIAYGGGVGTLGGAFTAFNPVEIHQATGRITNSRFEFNASGVGGAGNTTRSGRGFNDAGAIFVRGAQPTIVGNVFVSNESPVVSANVNALNHQIHTDVGRQTGIVDQIVNYQDNYGILVRDNTYSDNAINGMEVRGGTLTTESVWDDTDITHVVREGIYVPNFHTFGGLRLQSSPIESLVVKFLGENAGITTTGTAIGIPDHIGGRVQVLGQPGHPVILTSLYDDTVGAGIDTNGQAITDTNNGGRPNRSIPISDRDGFRIRINFGPNISLDQDMVDAVIKAANLWEQEIEDQMVLVLDVELADLGIGSIHDNGGNNFLGDSMQVTTEFLQLDYGVVMDAMRNDARDHESIIDDLPDFQTFRNNVILPEDNSNPYRIGEMSLTRANAKALELGDDNSLPGAASQFGSGSIDGTILIHNDRDLWDLDRKNPLLTYRQDLQTEFMRSVGTILGFTSSMDQVTAALAGSPNHLVNPTPLDLFRFEPGGESRANFTVAPRVLDPRIDDQVFYAGGDYDPGAWPIPEIMIGEVPLSTGFATANERNDFFGAGFWRDDVYFRQDKLIRNTPIGVMDPASRHFNEVRWAINPFNSTEGLIVHVSEQDRLALDVIGYDVVGGAAGDWQGITLERLSHDRNAHALIEQESPDGPAPGVNGTTGVAQNIGTIASDKRNSNENQQLGFEIRGLINAPNDVDVYSFDGTAGTELWIDIDRTSPSLNSVVELIDESGQVLARSDDSHAEAVLGVELDNAVPLGPSDLYTSNPFDAGLITVLPGAVGSENTYYVRVASDGLTAGAYQLQLRLQSMDEVPGTIISFSDIRFADTGVRIVGPPISSPLTGEHVEDESFNDTNEEFDTFLVGDDGGVTDDVFFFSSLPWDVEAQNIGNLLSTDLGAISVFGSIYNSDDIDWYEFRVAYDGILDVEGPPDLLFDPDAGPFDPPTIVNAQDPLYAGVVFDIDYADGLSRPSLALAVYNDLGELIYYSNNPQENVIPDDQNSGDLSQGSFGANDPYIGPVALEASRETFEEVEFLTFGSADFAFFPEFEVTSGRYYVAVFPTAWIPSPLQPLDPLDPFDLPPPPLTNILGEPDRGQEVGQIPVDPLNPIFFSRFFNPFGDTTFVPTSVSDDVLLEGEYQLEIRYVPVPETETTDPDPATLFASDPTAGDRNRDRDQGHILVTGNSIRNSRNFGIVVEDADRDLPFYIGDFYAEYEDLDIEVERIDEYYAISRAGNFTTSDYGPHATPPRSLISINEERLVPGLTISNNLIHGSEEGALQLNGDPNGIVIEVYDLSGIAALWDLDVGHIDGRQFTIWDHQRHSRTFEFDNDDAVNPGNIPIKFDLDVPNDFPCVIYTDRWEIIEGRRPTVEFCLAYEIEHALRLSDLDIVPMRTDFDEIYIEGAVEIGHPGDVSGSFASAFAWPLITSFIPQQGPVPFVRVVNNTLVGRAGDVFEGRGRSDVGVLVEDNASPTILNNVVANFDTALKSDLSSSSDVVDKRTFVGGPPIEQCAFNLGFFFNDCFLFFVGDPDDAIGGYGLQGYGVDDPDNVFPQTLNDLDTDATPFVAPRPTIIAANVFKGNKLIAETLNQGDFPIRLGLNDPLFVDAAADNFLLAEGSRSIDSAVDATSERDYLEFLLQSIGFSASQIVAPNVDALGLLRVDDPNVEPPEGFGRNTFKDRGAFERADFTGPSASLISPPDNDPRGFDQNPQFGEVFLTGARPSEFLIQIVDGIPPIDPSSGTGADDRLVTRERVEVFRDNNLLTPGIDYSFTYDATSNVIRLAPLVGRWEGDAQYEIRIDNSTATGLRDLAGNLLQANRGVDTRFEIALDTGLDFGDAPIGYPVLSANDGARHRFVPGIYLGDSVDVDAEGQPSVRADRDVFDDGIQFDSLFIPGAPFQFTAVASVNGLLNAWIDLNADGDWDDAGERIVANRALTAGPNAIRLETTPSSPALDDASSVGVGIRFRFSTDPLESPLGQAPNGEVEDYFISINSSPWQNPLNPLDVTNDGVVSPVDAIRVINELNDRIIGVPATGQLPIPPIPPVIPERSLMNPNDAQYLDVNGDGFVSPVDALRVINALPSTTAAPVAAPLALRATTEPSTSQPPRSLPLQDSSLDEGDDTPLDRGMDVRRKQRRLRRIPTAQPTNSSLWTAPELENVLADIALDVARIWHRGRRS